MRTHFLKLYRLVILNRNTKYYYLTPRRHAKRASCLKSAEDILRSQRRIRTTESFLRKNQIAIIAKISEEYLT